jgi:hypothetical protein
MNPAQLKALEEAITRKIKADMELEQIRSQILGSQSGVEGIRTEREATFDVDEKEASIPSKIISYLSHKGGATSQEIVDAVGADKPVVLSALSRMAKRADSIRRSAKGYYEFIGDKR